MDLINYKNKPWWMLMVVPIFINCLIGLTYSALAPYLASYVIDVLGGTATQFGLVSTGWTIMAIIFRPTSGGLAGKIGSKLTMAIGLIIYGVMIAGCGVVMTFTGFAVCRILQSLGHAFCYTTSMVAASDAAPKSALGKAAQFLIGVPQVAAVVIGSSIGVALIGSDNNWQRLFYGVAVIIAICLVLEIIFVPAKKQMDELIAAREKANAPDAAVPAAAGTPRKGLWAVIEPTAIPASALMIVASFAHAGSMFLITFCTATYGGIGGAAKFAIVNGLMQLPCMFLLGIVQDKFGTKPVVIPGALLCALAWVLVVTGSTNWYLIAVIYGIGQGCLKPVLNGHLLKRAPDDRRSQATGTYQMANGLGLGFAATIGGMVIDNAGYSTFWIYCAVLFVLVAVAAIFVLPEPWLKEKKEK